MVLRGENRMSKPVPVKVVFPTEEEAAKQIAAGTLVSGDQVEQFMRANNKEEEVKKDAKKSDF
jgi:hypothetical protein